MYIANICSNEYGNKHLCMVWFLYKIQFPLSTSSLKLTGDGCQKKLILIRKRSSPHKQLRRLANKISREIQENEFRPSLQHLQFAHHQESALDLCG